MNQTHMKMWLKVFLLVTIWALSPAYFTNTKKLRNKMLLKMIIWKYGTVKVHKAPHSWFYWHKRGKKWWSVQIKPKVYCEYLRHWGSNMHCNTTHVLLLPSLSGLEIIGKKKTNLEKSSMVFIKALKDYFRFSYGSDVLKMLIQNQPLNTSTWS